MATKEQFKFIDERFEQLINDSKDVAEKAAQLLFLANAGGAAATLSFLVQFPEYGSNGRPKPHSYYLSLESSSSVSTWRSESTMSTCFSLGFAMM
jgi:hypothetical protein